MTNDDCLYSYMKKNFLEVRKKKSKYQILFHLIWVEIIILEKVVLEGLLIILVDEKIWQYYSIIVDISIDYTK